MSVKNATAAIFSGLCRKSMNSFAFALFCSDRNTCSSFLIAQKRSRTLPLLSHLMLLCRSKSSNAALTSVRNERSKRCCSADDALKKFHHCCHDFRVDFSKARTKDRLVNYAVVRYQVRVENFQALNQSSLSAHHSWSSISSTLTDTTFFTSIPFSFSISSTAL